MRRAPIPRCGRHPCDARAETLDGSPASDDDGCHRCEIGSGQLDRCSYGVVTVTRTQARCGVNQTVVRERAQLFTQLSRGGDDQRLHLLERLGAHLHRRAPRDTERTDHADVNRCRLWQARWLRRRAPHEPQPQHQRDPTCRARTGSGDWDGSPRSPCSRPRSETEQGQHRTIRCLQRRSVGRCQDRGPIPAACGTPPAWWRSSGVRVAGRGRS